MKKNNRKGFTIVELVIVIAVIAILAAVLIPTFSNVISKANHSAALQEARNKYLEVFADDIATDGVLNGDVTGEGYTYETENGKVKKFTFEKNGITVEYNGADDDWSVEGESQGNSGGQTPGEPQVAVTGVTLNKESLALTVDGTETLTADVAPDDATNKDVVWTSSDPTIATVDQEGNITAVAAGEATITVTSTADANIKATCTVTVTDAVVNVTGVTLDQTNLTLAFGGTEELTETVAPGNATNKNVTWTSSDEDVAIVNNGVVTAVAAGETTITATTEDGNFTATCTVTVSACTHTGGTATCTEQAECATCGTLYGELAPHTENGIGICTVCKAFNTTHTSIAAYLPFESGDYVVTDATRGNVIDLSQGHYDLGNSYNPSGSFTVAFWLKIGTVLNDPVIFANKDWSDGTNVGYACFIQGGRIQFNVGDGGTENVDFEAVYPHANKWCHVICVVDPDELNPTVSYWLNFSDDDVTTVVSNEANKGLLSEEYLNTNDNHLFIGADANGKFGPGHAGFVDGDTYMDDFMLFNKALTDADVEALKAYYGIGN